MKIRDLIVFNDIVYIIAGFILLHIVFYDNQFYLISPFAKFYALSATYFATRRKLPKVQRPLPLMNSALSLLAVVAADQLVITLFAGILNNQGGLWFFVLVFSAGLGVLALLYDRWHAMTSQLWSAAQRRS